MYLETVDEFLHVLLLSNLRTDIIKSMRKNIIDIYMGNVNLELFRIFSNVPKTQLIIGNILLIVVLRIMIFWVNCFQKKIFLMDSSPEKLNRLD